MKKLLILFLAASFILGCKKESANNSDSTNECNILQTLEEANGLIAECNNN